MKKTQKKKLIPRNVRNKHAKEIRTMIKKSRQVISARSIALT